MSYNMSHAQCGYVLINNLSILDEEMNKRKISKKLYWLSYYHIYCTIKIRKYGNPIYTVQYTFVRIRLSLTN